MYIDWNTYGIISIDGKSITTFIYCIPQIRIYTICMRISYTPDKAGGKNILEHRRAILRF